MSTYKLVLYSSLHVRATKKGKKALLQYIFFIFVNVINNIICNLKKAKKVDWIGVPT